MTSGRILSRHFFRRRARLAALRLTLAHPGQHYTVRKAARGPYRWYVTNP